MTEVLDEVVDATTRAVVGIDAYLERLKPASPWARDQWWRWGKRAVLSSDDTPERRAQALDAAIEEQTLQRWRRWLGEVPTLARSLRKLGADEALREGDLFEVKRFLYQAHRLVEAAGEVAPARAIVGTVGSDAVEERLAWMEALMETIHPGHGHSARFHLADELEAGLGDKRDALRKVRRDLRRHRKRLEEEVVRRRGGRFGFQGGYRADEDWPFDEEELLAPVDGVYRVQDERLQALERQAAALEAEVSKREAAARRRLSQRLQREVEELKRLRQDLADLDEALTKVALRRAIEGCWAGHESEVMDGWMTIEGGRHPEMVDRLGEEVQPIEASLRGKGAVVLGPNMGGKSAFLRLIGLSVWCGQMGFPVPAARAVIGEVDRIVYVGSEEPRGPDGSEGLSSFGREVQRLVDRWESEAKRTLWLLDEPCRGTHPREGAELAAAIVEERLGRGDLVVVATHFPELAHIEGLMTLEVQGLSEDEEALKERLQRATELGKSLKAALREAMDFRLRESEGARVPRDGRRVARALGLKID